MQTHFPVCWLNLWYGLINFSFVCWNTDHWRTYEPHSSSALFQVSHISAFSTIRGQLLSPSPSLCTLFLSCAHKARVVGCAAALRRRALGQSPGMPLKCCERARMCVSDPCLLAPSDLSKKSSLSTQARPWLHVILWWVAVLNSDLFTVHLLQLKKKTKSDQIYLSYFNVSG